MKLNLTTVWIGFQLITENLLQVIQHFHAREIFWPEKYPMGLITLSVGLHLQIFKIFSMSVPLYFYQYLFHYSSLYRKFLVRFTIIIDTYSVWVPKSLFSLLRILFMVSISSGFNCITTVKGSVLLCSL